MDIIETIRYLNSADGPNIPLRTLAVYCGCNFTTLSAYLRGEYKPSEGMRKQLTQGIRELGREIYGEIEWVYNRNVQ